MTLAEEMVDVNMLTQVVEDRMIAQEIIMEIPQPLPQQQPQAVQATLLQILFRVGAQVVVLAILVMNGNVGATPMV